MKRKFKLLIVVVLLLLMSACSNKKTVEYQTLEKGISQKEVIKQLGSNPIETSETDGTTSLVYECAYLDYKGEMTYFVAQDMLVMSRWECKTSDEQAYTSIIEDLEKKYGEGTADEAGTSYSWTTEKKSISCVCTQDADEYCISIVEMEY